MKKRVLYDTNVVLDVLLRRHPHYQFSVAALDVVEKQSAIVEGYIAGHAITTLDYLLRKQVGKAQSRTALTKLLEKIQVAPVTDTAIRQALQTSFSDFEDAVCHAIALEMGLSVIVTRNIGDFALSTIAVELPEVFCANINSTY
jgi:predicted nucleic acid-binding protein